MPRIPTYDGPQVQETALRTPQAQAVDVGAGGRAMARALQDVGTEIDKVIDRDTTDEAFKLEAQIRSDWQVQRSKLRQQYKGDQADGYAEAEKQWWDDAPTKYGQNASPLARRKADKAIQTYRLQTQADTLGYVEGEKGKAREANFLTLQDKVIEDGSLGVTPDTALTAGTQVQQQLRDNAIRYAATNGLGSDVGERMASQALSRYHASVAYRLMQTPSGAAKAREYLTEFGAAIPLEARTKLELAAKGEEDNQFAQTFAAEQAGAPLSEQLAAAAKITDPDRKEKTLLAVKQNHALVEQAKREAEKGAGDQAWQLVGQGKRVPEAILVNMDGRERVQLQEHLRTKAERASDRAAAKEAKTDPKFFAQLLDEARDNPEAFAARRLEPLADKLAKSDLAGIMRLQNDIREPAKQKAAITNVQAISTRTAGMAKPVGEKFRGAALAAFDEFQQEKDRSPTPAERKQILDDLQTEMVLERDYWFDTTKPKFQMTPEELAQAKPVQSQAPASSGKFTVGKVYKDAKGNRAVYQADGTWKPAP